MTDIQAQMPVSITNGTNTVAITSGNALQIDGSGVTQPISGSVTVSNTVSATIGEVGTGIVYSYTDIPSIVHGGGTGTATYTVTTGKTLYLKQLIVSASNAIKVTLSYGNTPTNIFTGFTNASNLNISQVFQQPIPISSATVVTATVTNSTGSNFDAYVTFIGHEQ